MLDVRTLFFVMIVVSLVLALSLWAGAGNRFRAGLGKWIASLLLQCVVFGLLAMRGKLGDVYTVVLPNALLIICMTLKAAAVMDFYNRPLSWAWHAAPAVFLAAFFALLLDQPIARVLIGSTVYAIAQLVLALTVHHLREAGTKQATALLSGGFLIGSGAFFVRAILAAVAPETVADLMSTSLFQAVFFLIGLTTILITSVGFLLLYRERTEEEAQRLAATDPLTETFNRRTFLELGAKEMARSRRSSQPLSLIMMDLDHFKRVNDKHGHAAGDMVLKRFVDVANICLRREDLLARYGGEEFCVLLPDVGSDGAMALAERIRYAVEKAAFRHGGKLIEVTVSLGVATLGSNEDETLAELLQRADEALYAAKHAGRNRVVAYPENSTLAMLMKSRTE